MRYNIIKNFPHFFKTKTYWEDISAHYSPKSMTPSWPTLDDCRNYLKALGLVENRNSALILGATPFFRKTLRNYQNRYVVDFSPKMILEMSKYIRKETGLGEKIFCRNWFYISKKIFQEPLDLIIGDLTVNCLPSGSEEEFFGILNDLLKPGGFFVTRIQIKNPILEDYTTSGIIRMLIAPKPKEPYLTAHQFVMLLGDKFTDSNFIYQGRQIHQMVEKQLKIINEEPHGLIDLMSDKEIDYQFTRTLYSSRVQSHLCEITKFYRKMESFCPPQNLIETKIKKNFLIKNKLISKDYPFSDHFLIFILQKPL